MPIEAGLAPGVLCSIASAASQLVVGRVVVLWVVVLVVEHEILPCAGAVVGAGDMLTPESDVAFVTIIFPEFFLALTDLFRGEKSP